MRLFTPALYGVSSELLFTGAALSITEPAHLLSWMKKLPALMKSRHRKKRGAWTANIIFGGSS